MHTTPAPVHRELLGLPLAERIGLAQQLLESVHDELTTAPLTPEQLARVKHTLAGIEAGTIMCDPFDAVMRQLRGQ
jgi:hypothetical protein